MAGVRRRREGDDRSKEFLAYDLAASYLHGHLSAYVVGIDLIAILI
jgi:hypothetical protein